MITYTGIGSRKISSKESEIILTISKSLSEKGLIVLSGNAEGSDITFQEGSRGKCVIMLPWEGFNQKKYDYTNSLDHYIIDPRKDKSAKNSVNEFHPNPKSLNKYGKLFMIRNYYQIHGVYNYPRSSFVVCCSDEENGEVRGGTGQAVRIANHLKIAVINIRRTNWKQEFLKVLGNFESII